MTTTQHSETEPHPWRHKWEIYGDIVKQRRGQRIILVRREHRCEFCPTKPFLTINVLVWRIVGRYYKYVPGVKIVRVTKERWLEAEFLMTSNLDADTLRQIQTQRRK